MSGTTGKGYVIDPAIVNYNRQATEVFVPASGQTYAVITKATGGGSEVPQTVGFEFFASAEEALAVSAAFNNGLDAVDRNAWGVVLVTAPTVT